MTFVKEKTSPVVSINSTSYEWLYGGPLRFPLIRLLKKPKAAAAAARSVGQQVRFPLIRLLKKPKGNESLF